jgi:predicted nucleic-acid-binding Zn-ribbon protein
MDKVSKCAKCGAEMEEGFALDRTGGKHDVMSWVSSKALVKLFGGGGAKLNSGDSRAIKSFRCSKCGYLELYAP